MESNDLKGQMLDQYKLYVEMTDRISQRRSESNRYYLTIVTGLFAVMPIILQKQGLRQEEMSALLLIIAVLSILICMVWLINILSYKKINTVKFQIIQDMESHLPFQCYQKEWDYTNHRREKRYISFSEVEKWIPIIFMIPNCAFIAYTIYALFY